MERPLPANIRRGLRLADIVEKVENRTTPQIPQADFFGFPTAAKPRGVDTKVLGRFCVKR